MFFVILDLLSNISGDFFEVFQFLILFRFYYNSNILSQYVGPLRFYLLRE